MVPAPLGTPSSQPGFMRPAGPPARSTDRPEAPQPLRVGGRPGTATNEDRANQQEGDSPPSGAIPAATAQTGRPDGLPAALTVQAPPPRVQEPPNEETPEEEPIMDKPPTPESPEETRPGLGPMVKKKSKAEVASAFRKIASAAAATNGFKPRAGGAAERLRLAAMKSESSDGPDGITGVVPAPSLLRRETDESSRPGTADPVAQRNASLDLPSKKSMDVQAPPQAPNPEVTVTKAPEQRPEGVRQASEAGQMTVQQPQPKRPEKNKVEPPKPKQLSEEMKNELESIDVDPRLLSGSKKAIEFVELLDDFGWRGEGVHTKSIEELNEDIERELNKAQIGGWFSKIDEEDERVEKLKGSLDSVIAECDELDGLLTLYGVELGVSGNSFSLMGHHTNMLCRLLVMISHTSKRNPRASKSMPPTRSSCNPKSKSSSSRRNSIRSKPRSKLNYYANASYNVKLPCVAPSPRGAMVLRAGIVWMRGRVWTRDL